jgi:transposase
MERYISMRLKRIQLYQKTENAGLVCLRFGISRPTLRMWFRRYKELGIEGLKDQSRKPNHSPNLRITEDLEALIIAVCSTSQSVTQ